VAARLGAETLGEVPERLDEGFPITVDSSASARGLELALRSTAPDGTCTSTGVYFDPSVVPRFPLFEMYVRNATFTTGRPHVRMVIPDALDPIVDGSLDPTLVTSHVVDWSDAAEALLAHDWTKLVFRRDATRSP
jgi:threonine dehydrogenase-like Zn-dependent dehydrogenase